MQQKKSCPVERPIAPPATVLAQRHGTSRGAARRPRAEPHHRPLSRVEWRSGRSVVGAHHVRRASRVASRGGPGTHMRGRPFRCYPKSTSSRCLGTNCVATKNRAYFGFGLRFKLIALHPQRSDSGIPRGVTWTQDSQVSQRKHARNTLNAATTSSKSFFPKLAHSL